jgi:hypothetical protein
MFTINITETFGRVLVRINRWPSSGRYPQQLSSFELLPCDGESTLALLARVGRAVELECESRRRSAEPELW